MIKKHVGKKIKKGDSLRSYVIHDSCNKCTLSNYIDLVCNANLDALIVSGEPSCEVLELARMNLIVEFSELSGNSQIQETNHVMREIYLLRAQIEGIRLAASLLQFNPDRSFEYFTSVGLRLNATDPLEKVLKRIKGFADNKVRQYNKAQEKCYGLSAEKGDKITEQHFNEQLAALSKHNGFRITKTITLAEYAAYLKEYSQFINRQEWQRMKV